MRFSRAIAQHVATAVVVSAVGLMAAADALARERVSTGTYVGDGVDDRIITGGYDHGSDIVLIKGELSEPTFVRMSNFGSDRSKQVGGGAQVETNAIKDQGIGQFRLGTNDAVNLVGETYHWMAIEVDGSNSAIGGYWGDGSAGQSLTGVGFQPDYVMILPYSDGRQVVHRTASMTDSYMLNDSGPVTDRILSFDPNGFTVGGADEVNRAFVYYYAISFKQASGLFDFGSYTGDGTDNRTLAANVFDPSFMFVKRDEASKSPIRFGHQTGDISIEFDSGGTDTNRIQRLVDGGFEVGSHDEVNKAGRELYWAAWGPKIATDIAVGKSVDDANPAVGDTIRFTITAENLGPEDASGIVITDALPPSLNLVSATATQGAFTTDHEWDLGASAAGDVDTLWLDARVRNGAEGLGLFNTATMTEIDQRDTNSSNDSAMAGFAVRPAAQLSIEKSATPTAIEGGRITYVVDVTNGGADVDGVSVTDALPPTVTYVSSLATQGSYDDGTGLWTIGTMSGGATESLTIEVDVLAGTAGTVITNTASVATSTEVDIDPTDDDASATTTILLTTDLSLDLTIPTASVEVGDPVQHVVELSNLGADATNIVVEDILPDEVTFDGSSPDQGSYDEGTGRWTVGTLLAGETTTLTLDATVNAGTQGLTIVNLARVESLTEEDIDWGNNTDAETFTIGYGSAELGVSVGVTSAAPYVEGATVELSYSVKSSGPDAPTGVSVLAQVPGGTTFVSALPTVGSYDDGTGIWTVNTMGAAATETLTMTVAVGPGTAGTTINASTSVHTLDQSDVDPSNDVAATSFLISELTNFSVKFGADDVTPAVGDTVVFLAELENQGPAIGTNVVVSQAIHPTFDVLGYTSTAGVFDAGSGLWVVPSMSVAEIDSLWIRAFVPAGSEGASTLNSSMFLSAGQIDSDGSDDAASVGVDVRATVTLSLDVAASASNASVGDPITFTATASNLGSLDAHNINVEVVAPANVTLDAIGETHGSYDGSLVWSIPVLASSEVAVLTLDGTIEAAAEGTVVTVPGQVTGADEEVIDPAGTFDSASVTVGFVPDVAISLSSDRTSALEGDTVTYTLRATNTGGVDVTNVATTLPISPLVSYVTHAGAGLFDPATGAWLVPALSVGEVDSVTITVTVNPGTKGSTIDHTAQLVSTSEGDGVSTNNTDTVQVTVTETVDVALDASADRSTIGVGEAVTFTIAATNLGSVTASNVVVTDLVPAGLSFQTSSLTSGTYDPGSGDWSLPSLAVGERDTLRLTAVADAGGAGSTVVNVASVTAVEEPDRDSTNDLSSVSVDILASVDLGVSLGASDLTPAVGDPVEFTVTLSNASAVPATGVEVSVSASSGLILESSAGDGLFSSATGLWIVPTLDAGGEATLTLFTTVADGTGGDAITADATLSALDQFDETPDNDVASVLLNVGSAIIVTSTPAGAATIAPGANVSNLLSWSVTNNTAESQTLTSITVTNAASGPGSTADLDGSWSTLQLLTAIRGDFVPIDDLRRMASFVGGEATFADLDIKLTPGAVVELAVGGRVSLTARDSDLLDATIDDSSLVFDTGAAAEGDFPIGRGGSLTVDGMSRAQVVAHTDDLSTTLSAGSEDVLALDVTLPPNGYESDVLRELSVQNRLSASAGAMQRLVAWADDGDGVFDPQLDTELGDFGFTGDRWQVSGLFLPVPTTGRRIFVSLNLDGEADGQIRLALIEASMDSGNDGPVDGLVESGVTQSISTADRVRFAAEPHGQRAASPGDDNVLLLHFTAQNFYTTSREMTELRVTNRISSSSATTMSELDQVVAQLRLAWDSNGNNEYDDGDEIVAEGGFVDGVCEFTGLEEVPLLPSELVHLYVVGDVSLDDAADLDELRAEISDALAVSFDVATATAAVWPIGTDVPAVVDGLVAAQIDLEPISPVTLGAGEGPALAFDFHVPNNGFADDLLNGIKFENFGTATDADLSELRLFRDGGDGAFDAGAGDDTDLGALSFVSGRWRSPFLTETISTDGARIYVGVTVDTAPTDSSTVQLGLPLDAFTMSSGNDGPIDESVSTPTELLLSSAPLSQTFTVDAERSTVGQDITVRMTVRNSGDETISGITPSPIGIAGDATVALLAGPTPPTLDLVPDEVQSFTWVYQATGPGTIRWQGDAGGIGDDSGLERRSLTSSSNVHTIFSPAMDVELFPTANMPPAVTRGGLAGIIPLTVTFRNPGAADASDIEVRMIQLEVADASGAGLVPAELIDRAVLSEGADVFVDRTGLETSGSTITLALDTPLVLRGAESATLGLRLFVSATTLVEDFQVIIPDASYVVAVDAISEANVGAVLPSDAFPISSGIATLVGSADGLLVSGEAVAPQPSSVGQSDIELMRLSLENQSSEGQVSTIELGELALRLLDSTGMPIGDMSSVFDAIRIESNGVLHADASLVSLAPSSVVTLPFDLVVEIPPDELVEIVFTGDASGSATPQDLRLELHETSRVVARDETSGEPVTVTFLGGAIESRVHTFQHAATEMRVESAPAFPANLVVGAQNTDAVTIDLRHPGGGSTADIRVEGLRISCVNGSGQLMDGGGILDGLRVYWNDALLADAGDPGSGTEWVVPVSGLTIGAQDTGALRLEIDIEATAPLANLELLIAADGVSAVDANSALPVTVVGEDGFLPPMRTGVTQLTLPADELVVGFTDRTPAVIAGTDQALTIASVVLTNTASMGGTPIDVETLVVRARDLVGEAIDIGSVIDDVSLVVDGEVVAEVIDLSVTDATAQLTFSPPLPVPPAASLDVDLQVVVDASSATPGFSVGLDRADVVVTQPGGAILEISIEPDVGESFPYYTRPMTRTARSLADSYSNFPNPFAAGRDATRFVYFLEADARVTLAVYSVRGRRVVTLVDGDRLAGLHQDTTWDGRNGNGDVVRNGVYVAEIQVAYDDGRRSVERRKVAVVR